MKQTFECKVNLFSYNSLTFPEGVGCDEEEWKLHQKFAVDEREEPSGWGVQQVVLEISDVRRGDVPQLNRKGSFYIAR